MKPVDDLNGIGEETVSDAPQPGRTVRNHDELGRQVSALPEDPGFHLMPVIQQRAMKAVRAA